MINLRNAAIKNEISKNKNPNKKIGIVEKIHDFNNQQKGEGLKTLIPRQTLQRLPIALAQVKAGNISENVLNEIRQFTLFLNQAKEITKKVYISMMNSVKF